MSTIISVVLSTHNPHKARLRRVLDSLHLQSLEKHLWELIVVDNASQIALSVSEIRAVTFPNMTLIREDRLGLTFGRLAGLRVSNGSLIVFVDDDNVLARDYLANVVSIFQNCPALGIGGGKSLPEWELGSPQYWVEEFFGNLALRDLGHQQQTASLKDWRVYPACAPIGAGMIARRDAIQIWIDKCNLGRVAPGRQGKELSSGEDCDIVMSAFCEGWEVGYFPQLILTHLIPAGKLTREYLGRLNYGIAKSWVMVLDDYGIRPWAHAAAWTVPFRKARAYFRYRAWAGPAEYVRWRGACGQFDGRSIILRNIEKESANA